MTVRQALGEGSRALSDRGVDTATLDATVLLAEALGVTKERLWASLPDSLPETALHSYRVYLDKRIAGIPVSYLRKCKEFYGVEFLVDERVLVPRPETETLVEQAIQTIAANQKMTRMHDTCTGSGCVAIVCAGVFPALEVSVSDVSPAALDVCRENSRRVLGRELATWRSDLLEDVPGVFDAITANPPYLTDDEVDRMAASRWPEPELALRGGGDGMGVLRRLVEQAPNHLSADGVMMMECGAYQGEKVVHYMRGLGWRDVVTACDLAGFERVLIGRRPA